VDEERQRWKKASPGSWGHRKEEEKEEQRRLLV
jgi:hypothetical protein